jgi:hypothetical protein
VRGIDICWPQGFTKGDKEIVYCCEERPGGTENNKILEEAFAVLSLPHPRTCHLFSNITKHEILME